MHNRLDWRGVFGVQMNIFEHVTVKTVLLNPKA